MTRVEMEITDRNGYPEFTMSNEHGQGQDSIKPRTDNQKKLLRLWNEWHLNGMHAGTENQENALEVFRSQWEWVRGMSNYNARVDYLKKHKFDGSDLSIVEYDKSEKAIKEYLEELKAFSSLRNAIMKQSNVSVVTYKPETDLEKKYFEEFIDMLWDLVIVKDDKLLQPLNRVRSPGHDKLKQSLDTIKVEYSEDIFISAYVDKYQGVPYLYGHGWITKDLPDDFLETIIEPLLDELDTEEYEYNEKLITEDMIDEEFFKDHADTINTTPEKLMAMCLHCDVSLNGLENIEEDWGNRFTIEGQDYLVCTDEEANDEHLKYIEGLVEEGGTSYFNGFGKPSVSMDEDGYITISAGEVTMNPSERGNSLSGYDGNENEVTVKGETFYLYKN